MRKEIRIAGFGGQGIALAGYILGKAVSLYDGLEAVLTQSYGPEARGGASSADLIVADQTIAYPFAQSTDILAAMSQEAYLKFRPETRPDALVLIDRDLVEPLPEDSPHSIPASRLAEELGRRIVANVVMLGFLTASSRMVSRQAVVKAIETSVKSKTVPLNLQAFEVGFNYASAEPSGQEPTR